VSDELTDADRVLLEGDAPAATRPSVEPIAILIAGMHRSGTSALVRVLNLLGVDLPTTLYPARDDNPLGYWEPLPVVEAHEAFLAEIGSSFDDVFTLPPGALRGAAARGLEDRLVRILESEFGGSRQFVVKDPRLCRLAPIWIAALERFGAAPRFVLPIRNPLEVAASLKIRNEYSTTRSLLLWLRHMLEAERHTRGFPRSVVSYEHLLRDWDGTVEKVGHDLGVSWPRRSHAARAEIEQFLSPRGRHHSFDVDELRARADIVDWVKTTYEVFAAAAGGSRLEEDVLDTLRDELDRADSAFGPLLAELELAQRTQQEALAEQAAELEKVGAAAEAAAGEATAEISRLREDLSRREEAVTAANAEAATSRRQIEQLQAELAQQEQALAAASAQVEQLQTELAQKEQMLAEARADAQRLITELAQREQALTASSAEAASTRQQVERLQTELAQKEQMLAEARADAQRLTIELTRHQQELAEVQAGSQALEQRVQDLVEESAAHAADAQSALEEVTNLRNEAAARREQLVATRAAAAEGREQRKELSRELAVRIEALAASEVETQRLRTESEALRAANAAVDSQVSGLRTELTEANRIHEETQQNLAAAVTALADREAQLAKIQSRRFVRPRTRLRALSQLLSWLFRPLRGWRLIGEYVRLRRAGTFQAEAYLAENPDVDASGLNPLMHYLEHGRREGRTSLGTVREATAPPTRIDAPAARPSIPPPAASRTTATASSVTRGVDFSDFVVLLARQRSGTNPLKWVLTSHEDITCFSEIFSVLDSDSDDRDFEGRAFRDVNFLNFASRAAPNWAQPGVVDHRQLFLAFLEYLRCFSDKRYSLIDIKYNTTHLLAEPWARSIASPLLFDVVVEENMKVINLTRKNHLRFYLSNQKALESGDWHIWGKRTAGYQDQAVRLECDDLLDELRTRSEEDAAISQRFESYPGYRTLEYTELFESDGTLSPTARRSITDLLGVPDEWGSNVSDHTPKQNFGKQSSLPLEESIENYDEVARTLAGTEFESFLEDEPNYRTS
jgi:hypothetical protein